jgi:uncharacterized protein DUF3551
MRTFITVGLALSAVFAASERVHAYVNYQWCYIGDNRGIDCVFSTREQCAADGRNRGFGGQCMRNPNYNPNLPAVVGPGQAATSGPLPRKSRRH